MRFKQLTIIIMAVFALVAFCTSVQARDYYVLKQSAAGYQDAYKKYGKEKHWDGSPYLMSSISEAYTRCVTGSYDTIHVLSGHTEDVATPLTIAKTGVAIIGEGTGADRPHIGNYSNTTTQAAISITANYCTLKNLIFDAPTADNAIAAIGIGKLGAKESDYVTKGTVIDNCKINTSVYGANISSNYGVIFGLSEQTIFSNNDIDAFGGSTTYCPAVILDIAHYITDTSITNNAIRGYVGTSGGGLLDEASAPTAIAGLSVVSNVFSISGTSKAGVLLSNGAHLGDFIDNYVSGTAANNVTGLKKSGNKTNVSGTQTDNALF
jgi:hypothetical protein